MHIAVIFGLAIVQRLFLQVVDHVQLDFDNGNGLPIFISVPILLQQKQPAIIILCTLHTFAQKIDFICR